MPSRGHLSPEIGHINVNLALNPALRPDNSPTSPGNPHPYARRLARDRGPVRDRKQPGHSPPARDRALPPPPRAPRVRPAPASRRLRRPRALPSAAPAVVAVARARLPGRPPDRTVAVAAPGAAGGHRGTPSYRRSSASSLPKHSAQTPSGTRCIDRSYRAASPPVCHRHRPLAAFPPIMPRLRAPPLPPTLRQFSGHHRHQNFRATGSEDNSTYGVRSDEAPVFSNCVKYQTQAHFEAAVISHRSQRSFAMPRWSHY